MVTSFYYVILKNSCRVINQAGPRSDTGLGVLTLQHEWPEPQCGCFPWLPATAVSMRRLVFSDPIR